MSPLKWVFIEFAGFTIGKSASAYATPWNGYPGNNTSFLMGGPDNVTGVNNIQYTAQFGNGVSGTIGLDDPTVYNRTAVLNLGGSRHRQGLARRVRSSHGGWCERLRRHACSRYRRQRPRRSGLGSVPDFRYGASRERVLQHPRRWRRSDALSEISGHPEDKWGGAVMAALQIKNLPTGAGDDFKIDVSYSKGDDQARDLHERWLPSFAMFGGTAVWALTRASASVRRLMRFTCPGLLVSEPAISSWWIYGVSVVRSTTTGIPMVVQLLRQLRQVRYGGSSDRHPHRQGSVVRELQLGKIVSADYSCNPDFNVAQVGVVTRWTPVKNLTFSAEVGAFFLDQKFTGAAVLTTVATSKPFATYEFKDQSTVYLNVRAQRNF